MKPPRLLLGLALALWGSCTDLLWLGALLGAAVEILQAARLRRNFDDADFNRASDLGTVLSLGAVAYFVATLGLAHGLLRAVVWLPVTALPAMLAQIVSAAGHLRMRNLLYSLRRSTLPEADRPVNLTYPYFALILVSASIATSAHLVFLPVAIVLVGYALLAARPRNGATWAWVALLCGSVGLGVALSVGLNRLQLVLEDIAVEWLYAPEPDPYRASTRIGDVGRIKLSDAIVWRVRTDTTLTAPLPLVDAAYTTFDGSVWRARHDRFQSLGIPAEGGNWHFGAGDGRLRELEISGYTEEGRALLALPAGTRSITGLAANALFVNPLGAVKIADAPAYLKFRAAYLPNAIPRPPPTETDLEIPRALAPLFAETRSRVRTRSVAPADVVQGVRRFFGDEFRYSLFLGDRPGGKDLASFLTESRAGHCEYFATATTLLLRSFGVPARYVTGYSVQELGPFGDQYVVRRRHAHAWTQAYVDGAWVDVDTTPAIWAAAEAAESSPFQPLYDRLSWLWYRFNDWRAENEGVLGDWLLGGALLVCVWLYWRLFRRPQARAAAPRSRSATDPAKTSPYHVFETDLARAGYARLAGETPRRWLHRLAADGCPFITETVPALVEAHYEFEYLPGSDRARLRVLMLDLVERWRAENADRMRARRT